MGSSTSTLRSEVAEHTNKGCEAFNRSNYAEAVNHYHKAWVTARGDREDAETAYDLAHAYERLGNKVKAAEYYKKAKNYGDEEYQHSDKGSEREYWGLKFRVLADIGLGNYTEAIEYADKGVGRSAFTKNHISQFYGSKARALFALGRYDDARSAGHSAYLKAEVGCYQELSGFHIWIRSLLQLKQYSDAVKAAKDASSRSGFSNDSRARFFNFLAQAYYNLRQYSEVLVATSECWSKSFSSGETEDKGLQYSVLALMALNRYSEALDKAKTALGRSNYKRSSIIWFYQKKYECLKHVADKKEASRTPASWYTLGDNYFLGQNGKKKDYEQAGACYAVVVQKDPSHANGWWSLGLVHARANDGVGLEEASRCFRRGASLGNVNAIKSLLNREVSSYESQTASQWYATGAKYHEAKDYRVACYCYEQSLEKNRDQLDALKCLAAVYHSGNSEIAVNRAKAQEYYERAVALQHFQSVTPLYRISHPSSGGPSSSQICEMGKEYTISSKWKVAKTCFLRAKTLSSSNSGALFELGQLYEHGRGVSKSVASAKDYYQQALALGHSEAKRRYFLLQNSSLSTVDAWIALGQAYYFGAEGKAKDCETAEFAYQQALVVNPANALAKFLCKRGLEAYSKLVKDTLSNELGCTAKILTIDDPRNEAEWRSFLKSTLEKRVASLTEVNRGLHASAVELNRVDEIIASCSADLKTTFTSNKAKMKKYQDALPDICSAILPKFRPFMLPCGDALVQWLTDQVSATITDSSDTSLESTHRVLSPITKRTLVQEYITTQGEAKRQALCEAKVASFRKLIPDWMQAMYRTMSPALFFSLPPEGEPWRKAVMEQISIYCREQDEGKLHKADFEDIQKVSARTYLQQLFSGEFLAELGEARDEIRRLMLERVILKISANFLPRYTAKKLERRISKRSTPEQRNAVMLEAAKELLDEEEYGAISASLTDSECRIIIARMQERLSQRRLESGGSAAARTSAPFSRVEEVRPAIEDVSYEV